MLKSQLNNHVAPQCCALVEEDAKTIADCLNGGQFTSRMYGKWKMAIVASTVVLNSRFVVALIVLDERQFLTVKLTANRTTRQMTKTTLKNKVSYSNVSPTKQMRFYTNLKLMSIALQQKQLHLRRLSLTRLTSR